MGQLSVNREVVGIGLKYIQPTSTWFGFIWFPLGDVVPQLATCQFTGEFEFSGYRHLDNYGPKNTYLIILGWVT